MTADIKRNIFQTQKQTISTIVLNSYNTYLLEAKQHQIGQNVRPGRWSPLPRKDQAWRDTRELPEIDAQAIFIWVFFQL